MTDNYTVGDLVAEFLQAAGVDLAFGVVSVHNTPMLDAIGRRNAIRFVPARGEAGAGSMADAATRASGKPAALFTSTGPGAANAVGALVEARFAGAPMIHLTGQTATGHLGKGRGTVHEVPDQTGMLASVSKAAFQVRTPDTALGILTKAMVTALTPPTGPVSVEIPIDIQKSAISRPSSLGRDLDDFTLPLPPVMEPDPAALETLVNMVAQAKRPLLWLGNGATHAGAPAMRLLDKGFAMVTSVAGRGVVPEDHRQNLGAFNNLPAVEAFYETVDLMIVAGSRLRGHETREFKLALPRRRVHIDIDPAADGRTYGNDLFIAADAAATLTALADRLPDQYQAEKGFAEEAAAVKEKAIAAYVDYLGDYGGFAERIRRVMPRDALWVRDITLANSTWGNRLLPVYSPRDNIYALGAAIGLGMAHGLGAALASPGRKTVCLCGDGGFFMGFAEFWTAVQERADIVFLVMNDQGYGVIKQIQNTFHDGRHFYAGFQNPDLAALAAVAGMPYRQVTRTEDLDGAVEAAIAVEGPALVEVDMASIGPYPQFYVPPPTMSGARVEA